MNDLTNFLNFLKNRPYSTFLNQKVLIKRYFSVNFSITNLQQFPPGKNLHKKFPKSHKNFSPLII